MLPTVASYNKMTCVACGFIDRLAYFHLVLLATCVAMQGYPASTADCTLAHGAHWPPSLFHQDLYQGSGQRRACGPPGSI